MEGYGGPSGRGNLFFGHHHHHPPSSVPFLLLLHHGGSWGKRDGRFMTARGALSYLELCKVILSKVGPTNVHPRFKKSTNTKECGVQVNAKVDKSIQCSLGAKTLCYRPPREDTDGPSPAAPGRPPATPVAKVPFNTPGNNVRFSRPLSIYSPMFDRRTFLKSASCGSEDGGCEVSKATGKVGQSVVGVENDTSVDLSDALHQEFKGSNFQFLEQRYGRFHCRKCNIRWESAYVWCISGTSKVYYKQLCRKCQMGLNPYKVESILCQECLKTSCCCCESKQRHINMKRPHRQDLCCRCKGTRLSCDATYSFKYIV